jgi:hypothetical protein
MGIFLSGRLSPFFALAVRIRVAFVESVIVPKDDITTSEESESNTD